MMLPVILAVVKQLIKHDPIYHDSLEETSITAKSNETINSKGMIF